MEKKLVCISCRKEINTAGAVKFKCPNCLNYEIVRCRHCRELASRYICFSCEFSGPN